MGFCFYFAFFFFAERREVKRVHGRSIFDRCDARLSFRGAVRKYSIMIYERIYYCSSIEGIENGYVAKGGHLF